LKADPALKFGAFDPLTGDRVDLPMPEYDGKYIGNAYKGMIDAIGIAKLTIRNLNLDGNSANIILGGEWGDSQRQLLATGILLTDCLDVLVEDVVSNYHCTDGIQTVAPGLLVGDARRPHIFNRVVCRFNGRLGLADVGSNGIVATDCDFSRSGQVFNSGERLATAPCSGVDIEAEMSTIRNSVYNNCTFKASFSGAGMVAASGDSSNVTLTNCVLTGESSSAFVGGKPGYLFEDCIIVGYTNFALAPDASCTFTLRRCVLNVDTSYTETGVVDTRQSLWPQAYGMVIDNCVCNFGPALLPQTPYAETPMTHINSSFSSTAAGEHVLLGVFRGINHFTLPNGTLNIYLGTYSTLAPDAEIWVNGTRQH
jgi:hypothetical protein